jgi:hypothetical protein
MLEKLRWEMDNLDFRQPYDIAVCQYQMFNCAVTAWHVTDWLWQDISPELRGKLSNTKGEPLNKFEDFQKYVREACPALKLCQQVANGSKHTVLKRKISAVVRDGEGHNYGSAVIVEGDTHHDAYKVFFEAFAWFKTFLHEQKIFPEEPFVPMSD